MFLLGILERLKYLMQETNQGRPIPNKLFSKFTNYRTI
jgi:hypothetical protein